jgi:hypothetical protein
MADHFNKEHGPSSGMHAAQSDSLNFSHNSASSSGSANHVRIEPGLDSSLKLIAEQAQAMTRASGAAIALREGELMVCRARAGSTAPDVGAPLDTRSGLSGECVRTGRTLVCKDTESDSRVNLDVCRYLGIRSIVVMPIHLGQELVGVFEVFSPEAEAFGLSELAALEGMRELVLSIVRPVAAEVSRPAVAHAPSQRREEPSAPALHSNASVQNVLGGRVELADSLFGVPDAEDDLMCEIEGQRQHATEWEEEPSGELLEQEEELGHLTSFAPADHNGNGRQAVVSRKLLVAGAATVVLGVVWLAWCNHSSQQFAAHPPASKEASVPAATLAEAPKPATEQAPSHAAETPSPAAVVLDKKEEGSREGQQNSVPAAKPKKVASSAKASASPPVRHDKPIAHSSAEAEVVKRYVPQQPETAATAQPAPKPQAPNVASTIPPQPAPDLKSSPVAVNNNLPEKPPVSASQLSASATVPAAAPASTSPEKPAPTTPQPETVGRKLSIAQATVSSLAKVPPAGAPATGGDAITLLQRAAAAGDAHAQLALAVRCANGDGVHRNYPEAWKLFNRAASQGVTPTDSKSFEAKRKVDEWAKKTQSKASFH